MCDVKSICAVRNLVVSWVNRVLMGHMHVNCSNQEAGSVALYKGSCTSMKLAETQENRSFGCCPIRVTKTKLLYS